MCVVKPFEHATTRFVSLFPSFSVLLTFFFCPSGLLTCTFFCFIVSGKLHITFFSVVNGHSDVTLAQNPILNLPGIYKNSAYVTAKNEIKSRKQEL